MAGLTPAQLVAIVERAALAKSHPDYDSAAQAYAIDVPRLIARINELETALAAAERVVEAARLYLEFTDPHRNYALAAALAEYQKVPK